MATTSAYPGPSVRSSRSPKPLNLAMSYHQPRSLHQSRPRLEDSFDMIRREFDLLLKENSMLRQQRDDVEARMNQQMNELTAMHNAVSQLEASHLHAKHEYEHHISELHEKLQRQQASTSSSPTKSPTMRDERPPPVPPPPSVFQRPLKPLSKDTRNGFAGGAILPEPDAMNVDKKPILPPISSAVGYVSRTSSTGGSVSRSPPRNEDTRQPSPPRLVAPTPGWRWKGIDHAAIPAQVKGGDPSADWITVYEDPDWKERLDVQLSQSFTHASVVCCVRFSPDGRYLATGCKSSAQIFDVSTGYKVCELKEDNNSDECYVRSVAFSPDGKYLATGTEDNLVRVWDIAKKRVRNKFPGHTSEIYALQFSRDGRSVVSASGDTTVRIWDMLDSSCRVLQTSPEVEAQHSSDSDPLPDRGITSVSLSPSGGLIATGSLDNTVRIWDTTTCTLIETLHGHTASVYSVAFMKDGNGLVSGSLDKTMRYWDVSQLVGGGVRSPSTEKCRSKVIYNGHLDYVLSVGATSSNHWVVSGSKDRTVMLWDTRSGQALCYLQGHKNSVIQLDVDPTSKLIATGSGDNNARIWRVNLL
ncbi:chromatin associated protein [Flagelloscypha sp. PMI_526]|nr:chromatin associated protein [Flagelloscypha sp. PMI_526]